MNHGFYVFKRTLLTFRDIWFVFVGQLTYWREVGGTEGRELLCQHMVLPFHAGFQQYCW